jgi:protein kinase C substrate 80K-H
MIYDHGLRCWNGPERSARVELECGAENQVLKVSEPSKCEYIIKMKSPAVCTNPKHGKIREKEEL